MVQRHISLGDKYCLHACILLIHPAAFHMPPTRHLHAQLFHERESFCCFFRIVLLDFIDVSHLNSLVGRWLILLYSCCCLDRIFLLDFIGVFHLISLVGRRHILFYINKRYVVCCMHGFLGGRR